jgi:hypothetical protein
MKCDLASPPYLSINVKTTQTFKMADVEISQLWELMHRSNSPHWGFIVWSKSLGRPHPPPPQGENNDVI